MASLSRVTLKWQRQSAASRRRPSWQQLEIRRCHFVSLSFCFISRWSVSFSRLLYILLLVSHVVLNSASYMLITYKTQYRTGQFARPPWTRIQLFSKSRTTCGSMLKNLRIRQRRERTWSRATRCSTKAASGFPFERGKMIARLGRRVAWMPWTSQPVQLPSTGRGLRTLWMSTIRSWSMERRSKSQIRPRNTEKPSSLPKSCVFWIFRTFCRLICTVVAENAWWLKKDYCLINICFQEMAVKEMDAKVDAMLNKMRNDKQNSKLKRKSTGKEEWICTPIWSNLFTLFNPCLTKLFPLWKNCQFV